MALDDPSRGAPSGTREPVPTYSFGRRAAVLVTACLAVLLIAIDATVLHLAVPKLTEDLHPSGTQILWIGDAYSFVLAGLLVTMGNVGDRIGRKRLLLIGAVAFGAASAATAFAPTAEMLIAFRALLGLAGATLMPSTLSIIRNVFTEPRARTMAVGVWSAMAAAGFALGPIIGGALLEHFWWGSVFLINVPVIAVVLVVGFFALPESRNPRAGRLDPLSVLLSAIGIVGVVQAVKETAAHGLDVDVLVAAVVGVAGLALFVRRQHRLADPLVDMSLFRRPAFAAAVAADLLVTFALSGAMFFLSLYFQLVQGYGPLEAGLRETPAAIAAMCAAPLAGLLAGRLGRAVTVASGLAVTALGLFLLVGAPVSGGYPLLATSLFLAGIGVGLAQTVTADAILTAAPRDKAGAASAVSETAYELGTAFGIAILGSILGAAYRSSLVLPPGVDGPAMEGIRDSLAHALEVAAALPGNAGVEVVRIARVAFVDALHVTAVVCGVLLAIGAVAALFALRGSDRSDVE